MCDISIAHLFRGVKSGNAQLARDIVAWAFQENLVLRIDNVEHHKVNATGPSEQYTVNDQLVS
jgi:oligosaccharyltransferase complex subunit beta